MDYLGLSKEISYALRHAPWEYELELDHEGWVPIKQLLNAFNRTEMWDNLTPNDLQNMIYLSDKKRHEIMDDKIRALYGHSVPMKILKEERKPPKILYHGTVHNFIESILKNGLKPKLRQYVHLSQDIETAVQVGRRRDAEPIILMIDAEKAYEHNIKFYYGNEKVWLADDIPPEFITIR